MEKAGFRFIFIFTLLFILFQACDPQPHSTEKQPRLVILSLDGFRWDYPELYPTPNLDRIEKTGVRAEAIIPSFPSKTFPNHYTMVTGLFPDHHGLINNTFLDKERNEIFKISDRDKVEDGYYFGGEPIWLTAHRNGLKTASYFWVGSEAEIQGYRPDTWKSFDSSVPFTDRMDTVLYWLNLPEGKGPDLITWYIEEPDGVGHDFGPVSEQTARMVVRLDSIVGLFMAGLEKVRDSENINLIITSDHGMGETDGNKWINLNDYLPENQVSYLLGYNPMFLLQPAEGFTDSLAGVLGRVNGISVWKKENIPSDLHFGTHPRITDLVIVADSGWSAGLKPSRGPGKGGTHGYDNRNSDMHAIFYAYGPAFKKGFRAERFNNTDLYSLFCELLKIEPAKNDGNPENILPMLKTD